MTKQDKIKEAYGDFRGQGFIYDKDQECVLDKSCYLIVGTVPKVRKEVNP